MFDRFFGCRARRYALGTALLSCATLSPAAASAATTVGSTQLRGNGAFANEFTVCVGACTFSMRALPGHQVTVPGNGVIVSECVSFLIGRSQAVGIPRGGSERSLPQRSASG